LLFELNIITAAYKRYNSLLKIRYIHITERRQPARPGMEVVVSLGSIQSNLFGKVSQTGKLAKRAKLSVGVVLLPDFTLTTFAGFIDALRLASDELDRSRQVDCHWSIIAPNHKPVRSSCGVTVPPWEILPAPETFDYVVIAGGLVRGHKYIDPAIYRYIRAAVSSHVPLIGLCTGVFALAHAGVMDGYKCCVHWFHRAEFEQAFPGLDVRSETLYIIDRDRISCAGGPGATDLAAHLIAQRCGVARARKALSGLMIEKARDHPSPQPHAASNWISKINSELVRRAILVMERNSGEALSLAAICGYLQISENTLHRAFQKELELPPATFYRMLRLAHGHWDLLHTRKTITQIAIDCGFVDTSHFDRNYVRVYGNTPSQNRLGSNNPMTSFSTIPGNNKVMKQILSGDLFILEDQEITEPKSGNQGAY